MTDKPMTDNSTLTKQEIINEINRRICELKDFMESDDYDFHVYPFFENEGKYSGLKDLMGWIEKNGN